MFRSKKDSGAPLEYRVTSRSAAQGVPCHAEQEECEAHIPQMETELEDQEENIQGVDQLLQVVDRYLNIQELTPEILNSFIEKIYIGETERYDGRKMQDVEIIYKFVGAINLPQYGSD